MVANVYMVVYANITALVPRSYAVAHHQSCVWDAQYFHGWISDALCRLRHPQSLVSALAVDAWWASLF